MRARLAHPHFYGTTAGELIEVLRAHDPGMRVVLEGSPGFSLRVVGPDLRLEARQLTTQSLAPEELNASNDG